MSGEVDLSISGELLRAIGFSLALTLVFEAGFFFISGMRGRRDLLLVLLVNVITNPIVVLLYWLAALYTGFNTTLVKIPLEVFAVLTEGFYYRRYGHGFKRPFLFSLAANAFSFFLGMLLQQLWRIV